MTLDVVTSMKVMFDTKACVLIDLRTTHSFVFCEFVTHVGVTPIPLDYCIEICTPAGESLWPT